MAFYRQLLMCRTYGLSWFFLSGFGIIALSCENPIKPLSDQVILRTDHQRYALNDSVKFTVTNGLDDTIGYSSCGLVVPLERFSNGEWQWIIGGSDICSYPLLSPNESRLHHMPHQQGDIEVGRYRFRLTYSHSTSGRPNLEEPVESWTIYSNEFWIDDIIFYTAENHIWRTEIIRTVITNPLRRSIMLTCKGPWLQQLRDGNWQNVSDPGVCNAGIEDDTLASDQTVTASFGPIGTREPGEYRVQIAYVVLGIEWSPVVTHSNAIQIW